MIDTDGNLYAINKMLAEHDWIDPGTEIGDECGRVTYDDDERGVPPSKQCDGTMVWDVDMEQVLCDTCGMVADAL